MSETYRVGIVGSGFGVKAHLPALLAHPRFDVVALASPHSAEGIAAARGIPHAFTSCAEMVAGCHLDVVVVASPPFSHEGDVLAALAAGKHVLCEKPFALNVAQAERMLDASKAAATACGVAHEFRWIPQRMAMKELVANGHLDPLREIEFTHLTTPAEKRERGWLFERSSGGGISGALLSHVIDTCNWLAGRPPVHATGFSRIANPMRTDDRGSFTVDADDGAFALVDYGHGLVGRLSVDGTTGVEQATIAVHGGNRTAVASGTDVVDVTLFVVDEDEQSELECKPSPYAKLESLGGNVPLLYELYDEWIKQIETGASELPTFQEAVETQRVLAAAGYSTGD